MKPKRVRVKNEHTRAIQRKSDRRMRHGRKAMGLCVRCGNEAVTELDKRTGKMVTRTMCDFHLDHEAARSQRDRDRRADAKAAALKKALQEARKPEPRKAAMRERLEAERDALRQKVGIII